MSYEKHTWVNNETITAAKMNNILGDHRTQDNWRKVKQSKTRKAA